MCRIPLNSLFEPFFKANIGSPAKIIVEDENDENRR